MIDDIAFEGGSDALDFDDDILEVVADDDAGAGLAVSEDDGAVLSGLGIDEADDLEDAALDEALDLAVEGLDDEDMVVFELDVAGKVGIAIDPDDDAGGIGRRLRGVGVGGVLEEGSGAEGGERARQPEGGGAGKE